MLIAQFRQLNYLANHWLLLKSRYYDDAVIFFRCFVGSKELASNLRMENNANYLVRIKICANYFCSFPSLLGN